MSTTIAMKRSHPALSAHWSELTDEELLLAYREDRDRRAFDELVRRYEKELYNYLARYLGDGTLAEDVFQATFLQVHLKCGQFEAGRKFRPWLYTVATNQAIDAQRRNRRHRSMSLDRKTSGDDEADAGSLLDLLESSDPGVEARLESDERRDWMQHAIGELPDPLRAAVALIYFQGMKYREAADVLAVPVGTVKSRMHTAVHKLHDAWRKSHRNGDEL
jgi:RNA polymerase sigma-70 factor, ECF subfamily